MAWHNNFNKNWKTIKESKDENGKLKYDERFKRMWNYYLLSCAGNFRSRMSSQLWQIVFAKGGVPGGYTTIR